MTPIHTTILTVSGGGTDGIGISNGGVDGAEALSFRDGWGGWNDDEYE